MGRHELLVHEQWIEFLKRQDIVGGNFYFEDNGECVGRIKKAEVNGQFIDWTFEWSARKGKKGWHTRASNSVRKQMYRISDHPADAKEVRSGNNRIEFKGSTTIEKGSLANTFKVAGESAISTQGKLF